MKKWHFYINPNRQGEPWIWSINAQLGSEVITSIPKKSRKPGDSVKLHQTTFDPVQASDEKVNKGYLFVGEFELNQLDDEVLPEMIANWLQDAAGELSDSAWKMPAKSAKEIWVKICTEFGGLGTSRRIDGSLAKLAQGLSNAYAAFNGSVLRNDFNVQAVKRADIINFVFKSDVISPIW